MIKISDIIVPISVSTLKDLIPESDDIFFSTLATNTITIGNRIYKWNTHLLVSTSGVTCRLLNYMHPTKPMVDLFTPWHDVVVGEGVLDVWNSEINSKIYHVGRPMIDKLNKDESKEQYYKRRLNFYDKFHLIQIQKTTEFLEKIKNDPNVQKRFIKACESRLKTSYENEQYIRKWQEKRRIKEEKKRLKEEKKAQKKK
ncbi:MAG: hypothetical protein JXA99_17800 [Candidatus Lokiarchaeota archaeon]|nr:hypothetical protein [Candidatus Lokiarchaeota archaeon]